MPTYKAPLREYRFLLNELLDFSQYANLPGLADVPADLRRVYSSPSLRDTAQSRMKSSA